MVDPRITKQADILVNYSLKVKREENVVLLADVESLPLVKEIYRFLIKAGASEVRLQLTDYELEEIYFKNANTTQLRHYPKLEDLETRNTDCYIRIDGSANTRGLSGVDAEKAVLRKKVTNPIIDYRVENTRWVVSKYPTNSQAQESDMSLSEYADFVFSAINKVDWLKKSKEQKKLADLLTKTYEVHIVGPDTDLRLGKKGRKAINSDGIYNMPDGEVFTSVVENRADGFITYSYPALYLGREFHKVRLEFEKGRVVKATAEKNEKDLNKILDMDRGARTIGELGIGNNFQITKFTKDILFDEKIGGSIHLALGKGYKETDSKNESGLHWDMIKDLRRGGELWFDDKLVQKNGKWLIKL